MTKRTKIGGLSVKCIKNRGFQGQNGQKFLNISSNLSKFSKNRGSLGESWSKWGSFGESERKKVGSFWWHMEHNPKLSAPPPPPGYCVEVIFVDDNL